MANNNHSCLEELRSDHERILSELDKFEADPMAHAKDLQDFIESFVEPHLKKEEEVLFPELEKKGMPKEGGPIGVMLLEHEEKRGHAKELKKALEKNDEEKIKKEVLAIISLLRDHIAKENDILFPMAEQVLTEEGLENLGERCGHIK